MNHAHLIIISLVALIYWGIGYWAGLDKNYDFWPHFPSLIMVIVAAYFFCFGIFILVKDAL